MTGDYFGWSVSKYGDRVVVGALEATGGCRCWLGALTISEILSLWTGHTVVGSAEDDLKLEHNAGSRTRTSLGRFPTSRAAVDHVAMSTCYQDVLDAGQADALIANLRRLIEALQSADRCRSRPLFTFVLSINQVNAYIDARILSPAQGRTLINQANEHHFTAALRDRESSCETRRSESLWWYSQNNWQK